MTKEGDKWLDELVRMVQEDDRRFNEPTGELTEVKFVDIPNPDSPLEFMRKTVVGANKALPTFSEVLNQYENERRSEALKDLNNPYKNNYYDMIGRKIPPPREQRNETLGPKLKYEDVNKILMIANEQFLPLPFIIILNQDTWNNHIEEDAKEFLVELMDAGTIKLSIDPLTPRKQVLLGNSIL